jgi:hypothetical protein
MLTYADGCSDAGAVHAAVADGCNGCNQLEVPPHLQALLAWLTKLAEQLEV